MSAAYRLIATAGAGTGYRLLVMATDPPNTPVGGLARQAEVLRILSSLTVSTITRVHHDDAGRIDAWLKAHDGSAELSLEDEAFFATQLALATERAS